MPQPQTTSKLTVFSIYSLAFFTSFGNPLLVPLVAAIMANFNITPMEVTLLISVYALPGACLIPLLGFLEDSLGRKPILLAGLTLCVVSSLCMFTAESYHWLIFWRGVQGLAVTPLEALGNTLVADNFSGKERLKHIGRNTAMLYVGVAVFPLLSSTALYFFSWRAAFLLPVILAVPLFVLYCFVPMRYSAEGFDLKSYARNIKLALSSRRLLGFFSVRVTMALVMFGSVHTYLPILVAEKYQASPHIASTLFSILSAFLAIACMGVTLLSKRYKLHTLALGASCLLFIGMGWILFFAPNVWSLAVPLVLFGIGIGSITTLVTTQVAGCAQENTRASIMSLYSTLFRASQAVTPMFFALFYGFMGINGVYSAAFVLSGVLVIIVNLLFKQNETPVAPLLAEAAELEK